MKRENKVRPSFLKSSGTTCHLSNHEIFPLPDVYNKAHFYYYAFSPEFIIFIVVGFNEHTISVCILEAKTQTHCQMMKAECYYSMKMGNLKRPDEYCNCSAFFILGRKVEFKVRDSQNGDGTDSIHLCCGDVIIKLF